MTFDRRLANITGPAVRGLYFPFTQDMMKNALHEIKVKVKASLMFFLASFEP